MVHRIVSPQACDPKFESRGLEFWVSASGFKTVAGVHGLGVSDM